MFSSYSGCRQYREDLFRAAEDADDAPRLDKLRIAYNHPGFIAAMADRVREALALAPQGAALLFTAHSLPVAMAAGADYEAQLQEACGLVAQRIGEDGWRLAFQSNNARSGDPWLAPTVEEALASMAESGRSSVVVAPIGFVCDHMEVVMDLDVRSPRLCRQLGTRLLPRAHGRYPSGLRRHGAAVDRRANVRQPGASLPRQAWSES